MVDGSIAFGVVVGTSILYNEMTTDVIHWDSAVPSSTDKVNRSNIREAFGPLK